jgi:homogentisate 1,2-dioxygenase
MPANLATPHVEGIAARQAHADIPANTYEREIGRDGFAGAASHMYHRNPPTAWSSIDGALRPRAYNPLPLIAPSGSPWDAVGLLGNSRIAIRTWRCAAAMDHLARNADGDELLFLHQGAAELFCDYGHLSIEAGDYLLLPRGTMWRIEPSSPCTFLMIEASDCAYRLPERGILGRHAVFDTGVLDIPALDERFKSQPRDGEWRVRVKRRGRIATITYPFNPLDATGWKGDLHPVRLNVRDIRPVMSARLHLPPSVRATFVTDRFMVCTVTPRPVETDPGAIKLPFFHANDDYDEAIFYHRGNLSSRGGVIGEGMLTFHPAGITHGPHPEVLKYMHEHPAKSFDNYSVMIDTLDALEPLPTLPAGAELDAYASSWRGSIALAPDASPAAAASRK